MWLYEYKQGLLKMIYIVTNSKNTEQIREIIDKFPDDEVKVVNSIDEVPEGAHSMDYVAESTLYLKPPVPPVVDIVDALVASQDSEYSKLCSLDNKTKNKARKKIEHQALKYINKHYKK